MKDANKYMRITSIRTYKLYAMQLWTPIKNYVIIGSKVSNFKLIMPQIYQTISSYQLLPFLTFSWNCRVTSSISNASQSGKMQRLRNM